MRAGLPIQSLEATITVKVLKGSENHRNAEVLAAIRRLLEVQLNIFYKLLTLHRFLVIS